MSIIGVAACPPSQSGGRIVGSTMGPCMQPQHGQNMLVGSGTSASFSGLFHKNPLNRQRASIHRQSIPTAPFRAASGGNRFCMRDKPESISIQRLFLVSRRRNRMDRMAANTDLLGRASAPCTPISGASCAPVACASPLFLTDRGRAGLERKKKSKQPAHRRWPARWTQGRPG